MHSSRSALARSWIVWLVLLSALAIQIQRAYAQADLEPPRWSTKTLIEFHQQHHPHLKAQDIHKLFYQSSFGVEHILADSAGVTDYLMSELSSIDTTIAGEPLLEQISLDGEMVRVNLRQFKALNLDPFLLVKVMFQSARETIPDTILFYRLWNEFSALIRFGLLKFSSDDLTVWLAHLDGSSRPDGEVKVEGDTMGPVRHSPEYSLANLPAYRVVRRSTFEEAFGKISQ